jgi:hypothetical protein
MDDLLAVSEVFRFPNKRYHWQMNFLRPRIYLLNWQKKKILKKIAVPPAYFDKEEYRFLKLCYHYSGARGITSNQKYIFIALQNSILVYDNKLRAQAARIDHELFNGIHEIFWHADRLYVTCAVTDSLLVLSEDGRLLDKFHLGNNNYFLDKFNLQPRQLDNRLDYRLMHRAQRLYHVNCVQVIGDRIYVNLNRQGSFVKIFPEEEIIIVDENLKESHNAQFSPGGQYILINDTRHYSLKVYNNSGRLLRSIDLRKTGLPIDFSKRAAFGHSHHRIKAGWLRGLAFSENNEEIVYLGLSPAIVAAVNYISGELIDYFRLRRNTWISIHGLHNISRNINHNPDTP